MVKKFFFSVIVFLILTETFYDIGYRKIFKQSSKLTTINCNRYPLIKQFNDLWKEIKEAREIHLFKDKKAVKLIFSDKQEKIIRNCYLVKGTNLTDYVLLKSKLKDNITVYISFPRNKLGVKLISE